MENTEFDCLKIMKTCFYFDRDKLACERGAKTCCNASRDFATNSTSECISKHVSTARYCAEKGHSFGYYDDTPLRCSSRSTVPALSSM